MADYVSSRDSVLLGELAPGVWTVIGHKQTSNEITSEAEIIDRAGMTDDEWEKVYGRLNRSGSSESIETFPDAEVSALEALLLLQEAKQKFKIRKMIGKTRYLELDALIESVSSSANDNEDATASLSWQGSGKLTFGDLPVVPAG